MRHQAWAMLVLVCAGIGCASAGEAPAPVGSQTPETLASAKPDSSLFRDAALSGQGNQKLGLFQKVARIRGARRNEKTGTVTSPPVDFGAGIIALIEVNPAGEIVNVTRLSKRRGARPAGDGWSQGTQLRDVIAMSTYLE